jgi:adenine-specific DNA-methyltransferase
VATNLEKLRGLLQELFQLDQADLDFGIYRIMNQKRDQVVRFLDKDLLPQVQAAFKHYKSADKSVLQGELDKLVANITNAGMNADESPKVKELRQQLAGSVVDVTALENEVFSHLFNFFRRYYSEGDFISLRRYKEGVYAIPYEGEEVKLHWANADQYYVKSSETFRDYTFMIAGGKRVRVHLVAASTEQDNNKAAQGKERRFVLADNPISEENGELFIRFEYRPHDGKEKQDDLNKQAIDAVLKTPGFEQWAQELGKLAPTDKRRDRTVLEKHLTQYTARNTFDYFIHKDLGGFLRRELDFYIKNEVMHLDDIEHESAPRVEQYLSQIKVIRSIAHKVIQFLEQLENFQKNLWLKKKFVIETNYCITLDRIPEELYPEIAKNNAQSEEWVRLFAIDEIKKDLNQPGYSAPLKAEFLKAHPQLVVDTRHFDVKFTARILDRMNDFDSNIDGLLVRSDNFHALSIFEQRFANRFRSIYIDPPYNTDAGPIDYKNGYRSASWMSLIDSRLSTAKALLADDGVICVTIDDYQVHELAFLLNQTFGSINKLGMAVIRNNPSGRSTVQGLSVCHEYAFFYGATDASNLQKFPRTELQLERFTQEAGVHVDWRNFRKDGGAVTHRAERPKQFYPIYVRLNEKTLRIPKLQWDNDARQWVILEPAQSGEIVVWPIDEKGKERVWSLNHFSAIESMADLDVRVSRDSKPQVFRRHIPSDGVLPRSWWDKNTYAAREHGSAILSNLFGESAFSFAKSPYAVQDCIWASGLNMESDEWVLDYFAGSGTTGHAVINLNREDGGRRKFALVEMGAYFDSVLLPRIKKVMFSPEWKAGKPKRMPTPEEAERSPKLVKYIRLESYEDALNNLELKRSEQQGMFLDADAEMREQYILSYMLDVESRGSQSLLNVEAFRNPDEYKLRVERNGETQLVNVDLVETFNWLLGLTVKHIDVIRGVRVVEGTAPNGDRVLVLWRNIDQMDNDALDKWFEKQHYNTREMVYDVFYVNGDNNLENLRRLDQTWKVRLIEEEFKRLMFDVEDV